MTRDRKNLCRAPTSRLGSYMGRAWNVFPVWREVDKRFVFGYTVVKQHVGQELQVSPTGDISCAVPIHTAGHESHGHRRLAYTVY